MDWKRLYQNWNDNLRDIYKDSTEEMFPVFSELKSISERYTEKSFIGEGSQKKVYRVFDRVLKREVAFAKPVLLQEEAYEEFVSEAILISSLEHPGIVSLYDIGTASDTPYFTMEMIDGETLVEAAGVYSLDEQLYIFQQICDTISFAHSKGVLNLDLKPQNIIIGPFFKVTILDWGIAKAFQEDQQKPIYTSKAEGTPGFMSPEQVKGSKLSIQTDVYMLGAVLFYILFKKAPITGESLKILRENTIEGNLVEFTLKSVPEPLVKIALKALNTDVYQRYTSVQALSSELRKFQTGYATEAENATFMKQCVLMYRRNFLIMNIVLLFVVSAGVLLNALFQQERKQKEQAEQARVKIEKLLSIYEDKKKLTADLELGIDKALSVILKKRKSKTDSNDHLIRTIYKFSEERNYDAAITFLLRLLKNDPGNIAAWRHLGFQYFIRQDFAKSTECFTQSSSDEDCLKMKKLSEKLNKKYSSKGVSDGDLINILKNGVDSEKWFWVISHSLRYHEKRSSIEDHLNLLSQVIKIYNPEAMVQIELRNESVDLSRSIGIRQLSLDKHYTLLDSIKSRKVDLPAGIEAEVLK